MKVKQSKVLALACPECRPALQLEVCILEQTTSEGRCFSIRRSNNSCDAEELQDRNKKKIPKLLLVFCNRKCIGGDRLSDGNEKALRQCRTSFRRGS